MILIRYTKEDIYCLKLRVNNIVYYERKINLKEIDFMKKDNRELLESLIENRLKAALEDGNENSKAFEEAMKAIDRQLEIDKKELEMEKEKLKQQHEKELAEDKQRFEFEREEAKEQFEFNILDKRHECEVEKEILKSDLQEKREDADRKFKMDLEETKQEFEMDKIEAIHQHEIEKAKLEANQAKLNMTIKAVEIAAAVVIAPLIDFRCKETFAHMLCEFEKDYNFTTMAGRSLSGLFKFKK